LLVKRRGSYNGSLSGELTDIGERANRAAYAAGNVAKNRLGLRLLGTLKRC